MDYLRDEIMRRARDAVGNNPNCEVHFKFTCNRCGERVTFCEPNVLYEEGECCRCGNTQPVEMAGFALLIRNRTEETPGRDGCQERQQENGR